MNPEHVDKHEEMISLLQKNNQLLEQSNILLNNIDKRGRQSFWVKVIWYLLLFGLPILFYSYFIDGIMAMMGFSGGGANTSSGLGSSVQDMQKALDLLQNK